MSLDARTTEDLTAFLLRFAADGQFLVRLSDNRMLEANPAMSELTGYSRAELLSPDRSFYELIQRDHRDQVVQTVENAVDNVLQEQLVPVSTSAGDERWFDFRMRVFEQDGEHLLVGNARDVSEQIRHEHRLQALLEVGEKEHRRRSRNTGRMISSNDMNSRLLQTIQSLRSVPELSKQVSQLDSSDQVLRAACHFITDSESGLNFGSTSIYLLRGDALELAYSAPLRITRRIRDAKDDEAFGPILKGEEMVVRERSDNRVVPIRSRGEIIGALEVGIGRKLSRIFSIDDPVRDAQESVIKSIADFIGSHLGNLELRDEIKMQVIRDKLTGLYNRRHFDEKLLTEFKRAMRYERSLSLLCFDIDHFKAMNDTHGHPQGDIALQAVANVLARSFRDLDTVCRTGGEEMAVIMPETSGKDAAMKADRVRRAIERTGFKLSRSQHHDQRDQESSVTVSIGVASVNHLVEDHTQLYDLADKALYRAKQSGRNCVKLSDETDFDEK